MIRSVQEIPRLAQSQLNYLEEGCYCLVRWVDTPATTSPKQDLPLLLEETGGCGDQNTNHRCQLLNVSLLHRKAADRRNPFLHYYRKGWQGKIVTHGWLTRNSYQAEPINSTYLAAQSSTAIPQAMDMKNPLEIAVLSLGRPGNHLC